MIVKNDGGQAALPTVLLIGSVITEIAIAGALIAFVLSNAGLNERLSAQALVAAQSGVEDAIAKIAVNEDFSSSGYSFLVDNRQANVTIEKDPLGYPLGTDRIISSGIALNHQRTLEAIVIVDRTTGKVDLQSTVETQ